MKMVQGRWLTVLVVILILAAPVLFATAAVDWQTGRLTTIEISGTGSGSQTTTRVKQDDLWWTYGICTGDRTYYAVSRIAPARMGLAIDSTVRFSATSSQITMLDSNGKRYVLRIIRQNNSKGCAGR
jgi:hypothetical protein